MNIAFLAHDKKKELMVQFCTAYKSVLMKHTLFATATTGRLIVNRVDRDMLNTVKITVDDVMDSAGLPLAGIVLEDPNVTLAAAFGKPLLQYARRSPAAKAYRKIANRIQGFREPITLR